MYRKCWLTLISSFVLYFGSFAQVIFDSPQMPTFNNLTTSDVTTGRPTLNWTPPTFDPQYYDPTGYIIYRKYVDILNPNGIYIAIDTVDNPAITTYTDNTTSFNDGRYSYAVASRGPTIPSQITLPHSNIFITSFYDSCFQKIDLSWEKYEGWGNHIEKYDVYIGDNPNPATYTLHTTLPGTINRLSILNVIQNRDYYFYIRAKKQNEALTTFSNLYYRRTTMPLHPTSMVIDSVIAGDTKVEIFFKIDQGTELTNFQVVRWEFPDSVKSIFTRKILHSFSDKTTEQYSDESDNWAARTRPFYYKIDALNSCPKIVKVSNHTNSITPNIHADDGMKNSVQWDELFIDKDIPSRASNYAVYKVIRYAYTNVALPPVNLPETDQLEMIDDVSGFEGQGYSIKFCYQIEAVERNTLGQTALLSRSRIQCVEIVPGVKMPDAIMPTDNTATYGSPRNIFAPTITFRATYTLNVYNRWGNIIFSGENKGWNGFLSSGELAKEGTYIYRLVVRTEGNKDVIKEGSFVVVYK